MALISSEKFLGDVADRRLLSHPSIFPLLHSFHLVHLTNRVLWWLFSPLKTSDLIKSAPTRLRSIDNVRDLQCLATLASFAKTSQVPSSSRRSALHLSTVISAAIPSQSTNDASIAPPLFHSSRHSSVSSITNMASGRACKAGRRHRRGRSCSRRAQRGSH